MRQTLLGLLFIISGFSLHGQIPIDYNYSTFGIIAVDTVENTWGCAFATHNMAIGQAGVYEIAAGKGIVASIAFTDPNYPIKGIDLLKKGHALESVFDSISKSDKYLYYRQIAMLDSAGNALGFTGHTIKSLSFASTRQGKGYVILGNSLSNSVVLAKMEKAFLSSSGPLYRKLLVTLKAAQEAGGQLTGKMSAAICVKKRGQVGFNETDYRVDFSKTPFRDLQTLVNKKEGLALLRRANRTEYKDSVKLLLNEASVLLKDWTMLYPEIAKSYYRNGYEDQAVALLSNRLEQDPLFSGFLPLCYFLHSNAQYQNLISKKEFALHDWLEAINSLIDFGLNQDALKLANRILLKYTRCSYLHFLVGKAHKNLNNKDKAIHFYQAALKLDAENMEANNELKKISN